jgi:hypothetical protein
MRNGDGESRGKGMIRRLVTIGSALSLLMCIATVGLWRRSYSIEDFLAYDRGDRGGHMFRAWKSNLTGVNSCALSLDWQGYPFLQVHAHHGMLPEQFNNIGGDLIPNITRRFNPSQDLARRLTRAGFC